MKIDGPSEFAQFWEQTRGKVKAYMVCACGNRSDADDLAQECYLRALRNWDRFEGTGSRRGWLLAIARNTRADWFRQQFRQTRVSELTDEATVEEAPPGLGLDDVEAVWRAVGNLEPDHREVIHLRFAADLSYIEIAEMLGVPLGTVRSRLHRALKAVREQMEEQADER
jgi:RNA polymerase sigma-70 factor (ECF subfamily)